MMVFTIAEQVFYQKEQNARMRLKTIFQWMKVKWNRLFWKQVENIL